MPDIAHSAADMISGMTPTPHPGDHVFVTTQDPALMTTLTPVALASFREEEGLSFVVPIAVAEQAGCPTDQAMRRITLNVYSALDGIGLTAAVASALADNGIACNMIAAYHHDHVFVPSESSDKALAILQGLQDQATA